MFQLRKKGVRNNGKIKIKRNQINESRREREKVKREKVKLDEICFVGDDLIDTPILKKVGLACAVKNACPEVKKCCHYITKAYAGEGAIREISEIILKAQNHWKKAVKDIETSKWKKVKKPKTIVVSAK